MSYVTNLILTCGLDDDKIASKLNLDAEENGVGENEQRFTRVDGQAVGGRKCLELSLFAAGVNYCQLDQVLKVIEKARWKNPEEVALWVQKQDDARPAMYGFAGAVAGEGVDKPNKFVQFVAAVSDGVDRSDLRQRRLFGDRNVKELMRVEIAPFLITLLDDGKKYQLSVTTLSTGLEVVKAEAPVKDQEILAARTAKWAAESEMQSAHDRLSRWMSARDRFRSMLMRCEGMISGTSWPQSDQERDRSLAYIRGELSELEKL